MLPRRLPVRTPSVIAAAAVALAAAPPAIAHADGGRAVRVAGTCGRGASAELRLASHGGAIRLEFRVDSRRAGERWRVVIAHERRVAWRGTSRTGGSSGSLRIRRSVADFDGTDQVTARATGPGGATCTALATLRG